VLGLEGLFLWGQAAYGEKGVLRAIRSKSFPFPYILIAPLETRPH